VAALDLRDQRERGQAAGEGLEIRDASDPLVEVLEEEGQADAGDEPQQQGDGGVAQRLGRHR
jgi:hypothetical protein